MEMHGTFYDLVMSPLERLLLEGLRRLLWGRLPRRGLGLEVGAGTGVNFGLHPAGATVIAVDASAAMLRRAEGKGRPGRILRVVADVHALPFRAGTFDWGAETLVFCEVSRPGCALLEIARVLRPGAPWAMLEHVRPGGWLGVGAELLTRITGPLLGEHFDRDPGPALAQAGFSLTETRDHRGGLLRILLTRAPAARQGSAAA